jgi:hypothetical protein
MMTLMSRRHVVAVTVANTVMIFMIVVTLVIISTMVKTYLHPFMMGRAVVRYG